jgi:arylsulfatase A-like enzyme/Flp pilus assembly protein TadD
MIVDEPAYVAWAPSPACLRCLDRWGKLDCMFRRICPALLIVLLLAIGAISTQAAGKPNIVLITLSSTRSDRMGFLGSKAKTTPNLDGLARQSLIFERAYSQAPLTVVSHATILTGIYPQTNRASEFGARLAPALPFVPDLLRAGGYRTAAFVGSIALDPKGGLVPGFDRGFSVYDAGFQPPEHGPGRNASIDRSAAQVAGRAAAWLARNPEGPFFLWVHLNDPEAASGAAYNAAVSSVDAAAGKLIAVLRTRKLYDDALVVVASDHGRGLGEHGEETHGIFLYDETIHVPLLLKLPQNQSAGRRVSARASLVDVAPTVLAIAGVPVPSQMQGQSLLRISKTSVDQPVYSVSDFPQRAFGWSPLESWRAGKYLYIKAPRPELYDLSADPGATRNLAQTSKATLETIAGQLDAFDRRFSGPGASGGPELTSSEMQKLASLGYVGLQKSAGPSTAATGVDPKDGIAGANKVLSALSLLNEGKPEKAAAILQPVMATGSRMYLAQFVMGAALARQQQYPRAIEYLRHAIELQPDSTWAHYEMGASLLKAGDYKTAVIHLEIASSRLPDFAAAHTLLAQAYDHLGRAEEAKRERSQSGAPPKP